MNDRELPKFYGMFKEEDRRNTKLFLLYIIQAALNPLVLRPGIGIGSEKAEKPTLCGVFLSAFARTLKKKVRKQYLFPYVLPSAD